MFALDSEFVNCFGMDKILRRFSLHLRVEWMPLGTGREVSGFACLVLEMVIIYRKRIRLIAGLG